MAATLQQERSEIGYDTLAGVCALLVGIGALVYAVAFIILLVGGKAPALGALLSSLALTAIGLLTVAVMVALYQKLRLVSPSFALLALVLGVAGSAGAAIHGGYDLANTINPIADGPANAPNQVDPRGLLTFGVSGAALFIVAWLIQRGGQFPKGLAYLGYLSAVLLVILYVGRLTILQPTNPIIFWPALLNGFLVNPLWYLWLGAAFLTRKAG